MSKANQAFKQNDEAVSPVIGVILMVAITVVLAAVVFVLVSNLGKGSSSTPTFVLTRNEATDTLAVTSADSDADWNRIAAKMTATGATYLCASNAGIIDCGTTDHDAFDPAAGAYIDSSNSELTGSPHLMQAGDSIKFCAENAATSVAITLVDTSANSVIGTYNFNDIPACA
ncbi:MAG: Archaeal Type pilin, N-terminal [Thermoplasmata archaeon]|nr:Archaeal Type pilin, N-terminal [Thermoplasmata archaeon]